MDARFYNSEEIDVEQLANDLVNVYLAQGYQAQQFGTKDQMLVQLKKGGDFEALIGMQAAISLTIQRTAGGVLAMVGSQRWMDKAAVGAVGIVAFPVLWPLALTAGAGALRQANLAGQVLNLVDGLVRQQRPGIQIGPIPVQIMPHVQQQYSPPPTPYYVPSSPVIVSAVPQAALPAPAPAPTPPAAPKQLHCANCNTPYEEGDTFCSGCGQSLKQQKTYCSNCHAELKPNTSFCANCGTSTFQSGSHAARPAPVAPPTPTYTPPPTPTYTPPPTPVYTPPAPQPVAPPPQPAPQQPYYVPSTAPEPTIASQPKVTIVPATAKQNQPATPPKAPAPQKHYYVPSTQAQPAAPQAQKSPSQPLQPTPIVSKPSSRPASDPNAPWGTLVFADGTLISLVGERVVVGRYDHDVDDVKPEIDLSRMQGSDTVSRVHASLQHVGSSYTLTDLRSTNATRLNNQRLEPDKPMPINDGDAISFGKVGCTFKKI